MILQEAVIIGLGMIGASFGAALQQHVGYQRVYGYDIDPQAVERALERGHITERLRVDGSFGELRSMTSLVVLAMPIEATLHFIKAHASSLAAGALVMDVGSTKVAIVDAMKRYIRPTVGAIGGHPMTGPVTMRTNTPSADLFQDCTFVLTPLSGNDDMRSYTGIASAIVKRIGARPVVMDAERHDRLVAYISHVNRLLPIALLAAARQQQDELIWSLAAGSFREAARPAADDLGFWRDVFATNTQGIPQALRSIAGQIETLAQAIERGDLALIEQLSAQAQADWAQRYKANDTPHIDSSSTASEEQSS